MLTALAPLLRSLRPWQWTKNLFVLVPLVFARELTVPALLGQALLAFAVFSALSSAVYLMNDLVDREADRLHPLKRLRPIASGRLPVRWAIASGVGLAAGALAGSVVLGPLFLALAALYLAINLGYTLWLKHVVILDVMAVSSGYVLRVLAGGVAAAVEVSAWLLLCTTFLALFLTFSKRRHELVLLDERAAAQRQVLDHYSRTFLDQMINVVTASTLLAYTLYVVAPETVEKFGSTALILTVPFVLYGIFRYLYLVYQRTDRRNPTEAFLSDPPFMVNLGLWVVVVVWILYGGGAGLVGTA